MENKQKIFFGIVVGVVVILVIIAIFNSGNEKVAEVGKYDEFAQCIADSGAKFYGAFWCPVCKAQKESFGPSEKLLPYEECSLPSGSGVTQICLEENIESYPTWKFADGTSQVGNLSFETLSEKTGCPLPGEEGPQVNEGEEGVMVEDDTMMEDGDAMMEEGTDTMTNEGTTEVNIEDVITDTENQTVVE